MDRTCSLMNAAGNTAARRMPIAREMTGYRRKILNANGAILVKAVGEKPKRSPNCRIMLKFESDRTLALLRERSVAAATSVEDDIVSVRK